MLSCVRETFFQEIQNNRFGELTAVVLLVLCSLEIDGTVANNGSRHKKTAVVVMTSGTAYSARGSATKAAVLPPPIG